FLLVQLLLLLVPTGPAVRVLWMLFGFFGTASILPYAVLSQSFPAGLAGRVNTGLNLLVFAFAFAAQWGIGALISLWPTTATGGYPMVGYQAGFGAILGLQLLGLAWFVVTAPRRP
ncbi:MAG: MFS transporter, partial [Desulfuromonadales bacterium]|nr:MFS transporter [Desulfuromonadales bacterium]